MGEIEREARRLRRQLAQAEHRLAASELRGPVAEVDAEKRRIRVEIATTAGGDKVLSPWVSWSEPQNGLTAVHSPMRVGDLVAVRSPSGVLGTGSIAERLGYSGERPAPSSAEDATVEKTGDLVVTRRSGGLEIACGGTTLTISAEGLALSGGRITHDDVAIDKDHIHTRVMSGLGLSGPPRKEGD